MVLVRLGWLVLTVVAAAVLSLAVTGTPIDATVTDLPYAAGRLVGLLLWIGTPVWFDLFANVLRRYLPSSTRAHGDEARYQLLPPTRGKMLGAAVTCIVLAIVAPRLAPAQEFFNLSATGTYPLNLYQVCLLLTVAGLYAAIAAVSLERWRLASRAALVAACSTLLLGWAFSSLPSISLWAAFGLGFVVWGLMVAPLKLGVDSLLFLVSMLLPFIYIGLVGWTAYAAWRVGSTATGRHSEAAS